MKDMNESVYFEVVGTPKVELKEGVGNKSGKPYKIVEQEVLFLRGVERMLVRVPLDDQASPYPAGRYSLDPRCIVVGPFGNLEISRARLLSEK